MHDAEEKRSLDLTMRSSVTAISGLIRDYHRILTIESVGKMDYPALGWKEVLPLFVFYGSGISDDVYENSGGGESVFCKAVTCGYVLGFHRDTKK
ncbi:hypothetical protein CEXT_439671 [Caerostris extrusa]|uniref:Uncharacterized protein n=1 Tax=Caerostris extrusa TaxID=172846 RepID=A0AAV4SE66_CAEEX|nr:hypothetical protein CEXT_439671 [Caerostris extrusa]